MATMRPVASSAAGVPYLTETHADDTSTHGIADTTALPTRTQVHARYRLPKQLAIPAVMASPPTFAVSGPGGASPISGGSPTLLAYDTGLVTHVGQVNTTVSQLGSDYLQNTVNAAWTPGAAVDEFWHYGDDLALRFRAAVAASPWPQVWVWVDGVPATAAPVTLETNVSAGSLSFYRISFSGVAMRHVRIYRCLADFGGLDIEPLGAVFPTAHTVPSLFILGDSYVGGTGSTTSYLTGMATTIGVLLGMEAYIGGQGGSGYTVSPGGGKVEFGDSTRIAQLATAAPDYVLVFGSVNDDAASGIGTAATDCYAAIAAAAPSAKVIVCGPPATGGTPTADRTANAAAVAAAAAAATNVIGVIDPVTDGWITGTGKEGSTTGDGNADLLISSDGVHPTQAGHDYLAYRLAAEILTLLESA